MPRWFELFPGIMTPDPVTLDRYSNIMWPVLSGLRLLRLRDPDYGEYVYAFRLEQDRLYTQQLLSLGNDDAVKLQPFNVLRREVTGKQRYITYFPRSFGARSWEGPIPDQYRDLPTFEPAVGDIDGLHSVNRIVHENATQLPVAEREFALDELDQIENERKEYWLNTESSAALDDAGVERKIRAQVAKAITELCDYVMYGNGKNHSRANRISTYAHKIAQEYSRFNLSGIVYSQCMIICEILRTALPRWPFERGLPLFMCGDLECKHRICKTCKDHLQGLTRAEAKSFIRDNQPSIARVLWEILRTRDGDSLISSTADRLFQDASDWKGQLARAATSFDFYECHFWAAAIFRAAHYGYDAIAQYTKREDMLKKLNLAEEYRARSETAVLDDFINSVDLVFITGLRERYKLIALNSPLEAELMLQKWIHDEMNIPQFWCPFVMGSSEGVPLIMAGGRR